MDFSDALGNAIRTIVHMLTTSIAIVPIFFSILKEIKNTSKAAAQRIKIRNSPIPTPNTKLVIPCASYNFAKHSKNKQSYDYDHDVL